MTLSMNLNLNKYDALHEWVPEAADVTDIDEETL